MRFRLLGPVGVEVGARIVALGPPQRRAILAALLVDCGQPVPADVLIDRVWGDSPPPGARATLYSHISRLRTVLIGNGANGTSTKLGRLAGGYLLRVERDRVDLHQYQRLLNEARDSARPPEERVDLLREALHLWVGDPLTGVGGAWADQVRGNLLSHRGAALVLWAQLELECGNGDVVIERLRVAVDAEPLSEALAAMLMRAFVLTGRAADALRTYATTRSRLADELGVDPGPQLTETYQALLRGDIRPHRLPAAPVPRPPPAQLPADVPSFVGRQAEIASLDAIIADTADQPNAAHIVAISGTAGVGKTTLAVHWAQRVSARFPDGQLYLNLGGFGPAGSLIDPSEALGRFLQALHVDAARIPTDLASRIGMYRSLLHGRRMLVVLDNAADTEQARPLLPGAPGCLVLVTSRNRLVSW